MIAGVWVSTNVQGVHYDKAVGTGFMVGLALRVKLPFPQQVAVRAAGDSCCCGAELLTFGRGSGC